MQALSWHVVSMERLPALVTALQAACQCLSLELGAAGVAAATLPDLASGGYLAGLVALPALLAPPYLAGLEGAGRQGGADVAAAVLSHPPPAPDAAVEDQWAWADSLRKAGAVCLLACSLAATSHALVMGSGFVKLLVATMPHPLLRPA
jgi:hypothetical protein